MAFQWLRRACLLAACASALVVAACGGGSIVSGFTPARIVAFGDAMGDLGQNGSRYTVNDGSANNNWTLQVANSYGRPLAASAAGGLSFAIGNARVVATPDAAGNAATPTIQQQIDGFLASGTLSETDLVLVSGGTSDLVTQVQAVLAGTQTEDQMRANLETAARALAAQVQRLVDAGAHHVAIAGPYNLGRSAWATPAQTGQSGLMENATRTFNRRLVASMVNLGADVLYVDFEQQINLATANPGDGSFALSDVTRVVCTSVDPGPGIGTGAGQVNSNLCTPSTLLAGADATRFLWADRVYPTARGHQILGEFAFNQIHNRW